MKERGFRIVIKSLWRAMIAGYRRGPAFWTSVVLTITLTAMAAELQQKLTTTSRTLRPRFPFERLQDRLGTVRQALTPERANGYETVHLDTTGYPVWIVEWEDSTGDYLARSVWDADTGELVSASRRQRGSVAAPARSLDQHAAARAAWKWMEKLGCSSRAERWTIEGKPLPGRSSWQVVFVSPSCRAIVIMRPHDYGLIQILIKQL